MYRVALNTAISDLRKKQIRIRASTTDYNVSDIAEVNETSDQAEKLELLYSALRQLSDIEKALVMLYLDNKSYEEMEDILGINQNNLRVKMNRIKEKLRNLTKAGSYGY
jgi:RNA polymerase sigma-70 factor (ECF subfamily)